MTAASGPIATPDFRFMTAALNLARTRVGLVGARPAVGALIVREGRILGRGATGPDGRPHAEALALEEARTRFGQDAALGATAYVTLEPCAHHGRTPPCSAALINAGISRVVSTIEDPDPRVSGRGFAALRDAGIDVVTGVLSETARETNRGFLTRVGTGRPWITLKLATTVDGRIATSGGESRWITGTASRRRVHLMRRRSDAVLVGSGTALADDPMLDVRGFGAADAAPLRVVMDSGLRLPVQSRLVRTARETPVMLFHRADAERSQASALQAFGVQLAQIAEADGRLDLAAAFHELGGRGINNVLVEGGAQIAASLLRAGLADELALFLAGKAIGADGVAGVGDLNLGALADAPGFDLASVEQLGSDILSVWRRN